MIITITHQLEAAGLLPEGDFVMWRMHIVARRHIIKMLSGGALQSPTDYRLLVMQTPYVLHD